MHLLLPLLAVSLLALQPALPVEHAVAPVRHARAASTQQTKDLVLEPCTPGGRDARNASLALTALEKRVEALPLGADPRAAVAALHALLATPCFRMAIEVQPTPAFDAAVGLKAWWASGGFQWLTSLLDRGATGGEDRFVIVPPDAQKLWTKNTAPTGRLAPWVCPEADLRCAADTSGWRARADSALHAIESMREDELRDDDEGAGCARGVLGRRDYARWRACIEGESPRAEQLPLARLRAPVEGWLVIGGRRGHRTFCEETRLYELATGSTFVAQSCGRFVFVPDGSFDEKATDATRRSIVRAGRVSTDNLRELAWALLTALDVERARSHPTEHLVPRGIEIALRLPIEPGDGPDRDVSVGYAYTELPWRLSSAAGEVESKLRWGRSDSAIEGHVTTLLEVVEAGFIEGCIERSGSDGLLVPPPSTALGVEAAALRRLAPQWPSVVAASCARSQSPDAPVPQQTRGARPYLERPSAR